ncbi:hypothetical protein RBY4I_3258 [Rhodobacterales bacterium Y4I]|nr:hypothetical protein RBY4I_3258 [Rhodobacterales bacterium Y4I]
MTGGAEGLSPSSAAPDRGGASCRQPPRTTPPGVLRFLYRQVS